MDQDTCASIAYDVGFRAGVTDEWMDCEGTLQETYEDHPELCGEPSELIRTDRDLWRETDHFHIRYWRKLAVLAEDMEDCFCRLEDNFWEGFVTGRLQKNIDLYAIAQQILSEKK